jgi:hypothetical protein
MSNKRGGHEKTSKRTVGLGVKGKEEAAEDPKGACDVPRVKLPKDDETYKACIKNSTDIAEATKDVYLYSIKRLTKYTNMPIRDIMKNPKVAYDKLRRHVKHEPTLKTTVATVLAVMKHTKVKASHKTLFRQWYAIYMPHMQKATTMRENNIPSDRQRTASIAWTKVLSRHAALAKTAFGSNDHLLLSFYVLLKPRRQGDYFRLKILEGKSKDVGGDEKLNAFVVLNGVSKPYISVVEYKTSNSLKPWTKELPPDLVAVLKANLKKKEHRNKGFVFVQKDGTPFQTRNAFTQYSNRVLKRVLGGNTTVNSLRHAYASYRNKMGLSLKQRQMDAMDMGHSLETHLSYAVDNVQNNTKTLKTYLDETKGKKRKRDVKQTTNA